MWTDLPVCGLACRCALCRPNQQARGRGTRVNRPPQPPRTSRRLCWNHTRPLRRSPRPRLWRWLRRHRHCMVPRDDMPCADTIVDEVEDYMGRTFLHPPNDLGIKVRASSLHFTVCSLFMSQFGHKFSVNIRSLVCHRSVASCRKSSSTHGMCIKDNVFLFLRESIWQHINVCSVCSQ